MDDDEEVHSHTTGSPSSSSPPNGRITVSVAAPEPSATPPQANSSLAVGLPAKAANGGGREDCWSEGATEVLIDAWGERYLELNRGNLKQKHWKEVADVVSSREDYTKVPKTDIQCKNRIDTVKKKYKLEKARVAAGTGRSSWRFFEKLDGLIGPTAKIPLPVGGAAGGRVQFGFPAGGGGGSQLRYREGLVKREMAYPKMQLRKRARFREDEEEEEEDEEEDGYSDDSLPPPPPARGKRGRFLGFGDGVEKAGGGGGGGGGGRKERKGCGGSSIRVLTQAILKFGEVYEQAESAKLQQVVEMEKTRMKFAKELELQRMQFFMKTQMEISQLKHGRRGGGATTNHRYRQQQHSGNHVNNSINNNNNNNSDSYN